MRLSAFIIAVLLVNLFCSSDVWSWRRRRRRRRYVVSCHVPSTGHANWANQWDRKFTFRCPRGKAMTEFHSLYSSCHRDRVFRFACRRNKAVRGHYCQWTQWINNFDQLVSYRCPHSGFMTGISSYHSNHHEDRRFKFRCCFNYRYHRYHCTTGIGFVNSWRAIINFKTPWKYYMVGATSYHDNGQEDRRWKFEYCKVAYNTHGWYRARKAKKN